MASTDPNAPLPLVDAVRLIELCGQDEAPSVGALRERIRRGSVVGGKDSSGRWTVTPFDLAVAGYLPASAIENQLAGQVPDSPEAWFTDTPQLDGERSGDDLVIDEPAAPDGREAVKEPEPRVTSERDLYGGRPGVLERLYEDEDDLPFAAPPPSWVADEHATADDAAPRLTAARRSRHRPARGLLAFGGASAAVIAAAAIAASTASSDEPVATITPTAAAGMRQTENSLTGLAMNAAARDGDYTAAIGLAEQRDDAAAAKRFRAAQSVETSARRRAAARKRAAERRRAAARRRAVERRRAAQAATVRGSAPATQQAPSSSQVAPSVSAPATRAPAPPATSSPKRSPGPAPVCEFPPC